MKKILVYAGLVLLYVLHNDLWYWNDARRFAGIPIGLLYHVGFCIAASLLFISLIKHAWPEGLEVEKEERS